LYLVPTVDGVAFRSAPLITMETQIRRLSVDEHLLPLEPFEQAVSKVGVQGMWIRARDQSGQVGYVAAWYVRVPGEPA
jgi:hypothetical protein